MHSYEELITNPTCITEGYTIHTCSRCSYNYIDTKISALGHDIVRYEAKAATCEEIGWNAYEECKRCGYTTYEEINYGGHNWECKETKIPTCTEEGEWSTICTRCQEISSVEPTEQLGHDIVRYEAKAATCEEIGWNAYEKCERCDYTTYEKLEALGHEYSEEWKTDVEPTCTTAGSESAYCIRCENSINKKIDARGHTEVVEIGQEPTCTSTGLTQGKRCSVCNEVTVSQEVVSALGHNFGDWEITKAATCTEEGLKEKACSRCQEKETEIIEVLGHDEVAHEGQAATCEEIGWNAYEECKRCDYTTYEEIPALGHTEVTDEAKAPSCTETGLTEGKHCSVCNVVLVEQEVILARHDFGDWKIDKEATYEEEGYKYRECAKCNKKEEVTIPILEKDEIQVTTEYYIKEVDDVKYMILQPGITLYKLNENITSNKELKVIDRSGNEINRNILVGTGLKIINKEDNKEIYTIIVKGDGNGDGKVDFINDIIGFNNYRLGISNLDKATILAGDINEDGKIDFITDIIGINNYKLKLTNSL